MKHKELVALMGKKALITKALYRAEKDNKKWWEVVEGVIDKHHGVGRVGWIVGARWLPQGQLIHHGLEDGTEWRQTGPSIPCLMICPWPTERPVMVPLDGYELDPDQEPDGPGNTIAGWWRDEDRAEQRRIMDTEHKRDARGRWLPVGEQG